jgi:hypothetical protein
MYQVPVLALVLALVSVVEQASVEQASDPKMETTPSS